MLPTPVQIVLHCVRTSVNRYCFSRLCVIINMSDVHVRMYVRTYVVCVATLDNNVIVRSNMSLTSGANVYTYRKVCTYKDL